MSRTADVIFNKDGDLSIDGATRPAGNIEVREYDDGEWTGGQYFETLKAAHQHIEKYITHTLEEDLDDED